MTAGILHGAPVTTLDLDIVHARSPENVALIAAKERTGRPKDLAVLPVLRATVDEADRRSWARAVSPPSQTSKNGRSASFRGTGPCAIVLVFQPVLVF